MSNVKWLLSRLCLLNLGAKPIMPHASQSRNLNLPINPYKKCKLADFNVNGVLMHSLLKYLNI